MVSAPYFFKLLTRDITLQGYIFVRTASASNQYLSFLAFVNPLVFPLTLMITHDWSHIFQKRKNDALQHSYLFRLTI